MLPEDELGWFTYVIRKRKHFGARYAAYRFTRGLPARLRAAVARWCMGLGHALRHALRHVRRRWLPG